jgi:hypothetical protein
MKFLKNIATTGLVAAAAIGFAVVAQPQQAQAARLRIVPTASQIDGGINSIREVQVLPNAETLFSVLLDNVTVGEGDDFDLSGGQTITNISYRLNWDLAELTPLTAVGTPSPVVQSLLASSSSYLATFTGLNITGPASTPYSLGTFSFRTASTLLNDEMADLFFTNITTNVGGLNLASRDIEVQGDKVPTPALIPGIAAMGMGLLRRKKAQAATA